MLLSAFILGLVSSMHCIGMCGPLQFLFSNNLIRKQQYAPLFLFHFSRVLTYGLLGLAVGLFGFGIRIQEWQQNSSIIGGLLMLLAVVIFYILKADKRLFALLLPYIHRLRSRLEARGTRSAFYYFGLGSLNGILPCAMVYLAIIPAIANPGILGAFTYMLLFGLGTIPALIISQFGVGSFLQRRYQIIQKLSPFIILLVACLLILRGMDLGIPYLSPENEIVSGTAGTKACP